jgi:hypothetical protein
MPLKSFVAFGLTVSIVIAAPGRISAAVPESVIQGQQNSAPEAMDITVLSKDETSTTRPYGTLPGGSVTTTNVTLTAQVDVVHRTASGLALGSVIVVQYEITRYQPPPGPLDGAQGIILNIGDKAAAYLKPANDKNFQLACVMGCLVKL